MDRRFIMPWRWDCGCLGTIHRCVAFQQHILTMAAPKRALPRQQRHNKEQINLTLSQHTHKLTDISAAYGMREIQ